MKTKFCKNIFAVVVACSAVALLSGCVKERNCRCHYTEGDDQVSEFLINVDGGMKCENLKSTGYETLENEEWAVSARSISCSEESVKK